MSAGDQKAPPLRPEEESLFHAVRSGDVTAVQALFRKHPDLDPNVADTTYTAKWDGAWKTPLHYAAEFGHEKMLKLLIELNADWEIRDVVENTPLHRASGGGHLGCVAALLLVGADVNAFGWASETPLHHAAFNGHKETVLALIEGGANYNSRNWTNDTPLHHAAKSGAIDCAKALLDAGSLAGARNKDGHRPVDLLPSNLSNKKAVVSMLQLAEMQQVSLIEQTKKEEEAKREKAQAEQEQKRKEKEQANRQVWLDGMLLKHALDGNFEGVGAVLRDNANVMTRENETGDTPLHKAAAGDHQELANFLLQKGADIDDRNAKNRTPLATAAFRANSGVVYELLREGADSNVKDCDGNGPLHLACAVGSDAAVRLLLEAGSELESKGKDEQTPLHMAARSGRSNVVLQLIERGANFKARDKFGMLPIEIARDAGKDETAQLLQQAQNSAELEARRGLADRLFQACLNGQDGVVESLIDNDDVDPRVFDLVQNSGLHKASAAGHASTVRLLIRKGGDVDKTNLEGQTALMVAVGACKDDCAAALVDGGATPNEVDKEGRTALHHAVTSGTVDSVGILLDARTNVNMLDRKGRTAIHHAAQRGDAAMVHLLLEAGANFNIADGDGDLPVEVARRYGNHEVEELLETIHDAFDHEMQLAMEDELRSACAANDYDRARELLNQNVNGDAINSDGDSALIMAAGAGHTEIVLLLLERGVKIDIQNNAGMTALQCAVREGREETATSLIRKSANIFCCDNNGRSSLHYACYEGSVRMIRRLLDAGSDPFQYSEDGQLPIHVAATQDSAEAVELLLDRGVNIDETDKVNKKTPLEMAKENDNTATIAVLEQRLKQREADYQFARNMDFLNRARKGDTIQVLQLVGEGIDLAFCDMDGNSALHVAAAAGRHEVVLLLLEAGIPMDKVNAVGRTPLHEAAANGKDNVVFQLLHRNANPAIVDKNDWTAHDLALASGHNAVVDVFMHMKRYAVERAVQAGGEDYTNFEVPTLERIDMESVCVAMGLPGSGKSSACRRLASEFGYTLIDVRDTVVREGAGNGPYSEAVTKALRNGTHIPAEFVVYLALQAMNKITGPKRVIFEAFPMTFEQARVFDSVQGIDFALIFDVSHDYARARMRKDACFSGETVTLINNRLNFYKDGGGEFAERYVRKCRQGIHIINATLHMDIVHGAARRWFGNPPLLQPVDLDALVCVVGRPGSGKSTLCWGLLDDFPEFDHVDAYDVLRNILAVNESTTMMKATEMAYITTSLILKALAQCDRKMILLENFPFTQEQADLLNKVQTIDFVIHTECSQTIARERISRRVRDATKIMIDEGSARTTEDNIAKARKVVDRYGQWLGMEPSWENLSKEDLTNLSVTAETLSISEARSRREPIISMESGVTVQLGSLVSVISTDAPESISQIQAKALLKGFQHAHAVMEADAPLEEEPDDRPSRAANHYEHDNQSDLYSFGGKGKEGAGIVTNVIAKAQNDHVDEFEIQSYATKHKLLDVTSLLLRGALKERPENPVPYIKRELRALITMDQIERDQTQV